MSPPCPTEDDLIALLDGEATENRAASLRAHLQRCASCREARASLEHLRDALAAPIAGVPAEGAVERILRRIEAEPTEPASPPRLPRERSRLAFALTAVGALAAAAAVAVSPRLGGDFGVVTARGRAHDGGAHSLHRDVGVTVRRGGDRLQPLADGESVSGDTTYAVSYRNLGPGASAFLMVFAVDSARAVHWIEPAYLVAGDDPSSSPLEHAAEDRLLPAAVALDDPAPGELHVVTLLTPRPLRVSQIEGLRAGEIGPAPLRARFPEAEVAMITLHLH
jgi:hypothetical protein